MKEDSYGSTIREHMKNILSKPAGEWKPLNQRRRLSDSWWYQCASRALVLFVCVAVWFLLNYLESFGRVR